MNEVHNQRVDELSTEIQRRNDQINALQKEKDQALKAGEKTYKILQSFKVLYNTT